MLNCRVSLILRHKLASITCSNNFRNLSRQAYSRNSNLKCRRNLFDHQHDARLQIAHIQARFISSDPAKVLQHQSSSDVLETLSTDSPSSVLDLSEFHIPEVIQAIDPSALVASDIGLYPFWTTGFIFSSLMFSHNYLPWWGSLTIYTIVIRLMITPLLIQSQKTNATVSDFLPKLQTLTTEMTDAQRRNDFVEMRDSGKELMALSKKHGIDHPGKFILKKVGFIPLVQGLILASSFRAIRAMCAYPIESLQTGGLWFLSDLTVYNPYLNIFGMVTLTAVIINGLEFGINPNMMKSGFMRFVPYVIPPIFGVFIWYTEAPTALMLYFIMSNIFSILQTQFLKRESVRNYFNLPAVKIHDKKDLPDSKKSVKQSFNDLRDGFTNRSNKYSKAALQQSTREQFERSAMGPIIQTFKENPMKK